MKNVAIVALLFLFGAALGKWIKPHVNPDVPEQDCDMWQIWHADRRAGVPIEERYGWPDQAGRYYKECEG